MTAEMLSVAVMPGSCWKNLRVVFPAPGWGQRLELAPLHLPSVIYQRRTELGRWSGGGKRCRLAERQTEREASRIAIPHFQKPRRYLRTTAHERDRPSARRKEKKKTEERRVVKKPHQRWENRQRDRESERAGS